MCGSRFIQIIRREFAKNTQCYIQLKFKVTTQGKNVKVIENIVCVQLVNVNLYMIYNNNNTYYNNT